MIKVTWLMKTAMLRTEKVFVFSIKNYLKMMERYQRYSEQVYLGKIPKILLLN